MSGGRSDKIALDVVVLPANRGTATVRNDCRSSTAAQSTAAISAFSVPLRTRSTIVISGMAKPVYGRKVGVSPRPASSRRWSCSLRVLGAPALCEARVPWRLLLVAPMADHAIVGSPGFERQPLL